MRKCLLSTTLILICITAIILSCGKKEIVPNLENDVSTVMENNDVLAAPTAADMTPMAAEEPVISALSELAVPPVSVDPDSVLNVIPGDVIGLVYVHNLLGLNDEINTLLAEMIPEEPPQEVVAKMLADTFGAGFETLAELEELGLDLSRDFSVFLAGTNPPIPSAAVHVKDAEAIKQVIEAESDVSSTVDYNGVTYNTTGEGGGFVILGDFMVYSGTSEVCEKAIDTYKKAMPSIAMNARYASLKLDTESGMNDLVAYVAAEPIVENFLPVLTEKADEIKTGMHAYTEMNPQLASGLGMSLKMIDGGIWLLDQADALTLTLQLNGSDLQISPFLRFKSDSKVQEYISRMPVKLTHLENLPQSAFLNGSTQGSPEDMIRLITVMMKMFIPTDSEVDEERPEHAWGEFTKQISDFYALLGSEASTSVNFSESLMPDVLQIYDTTDEAGVRVFMDEQYLAYLQASHGIYEAMGTSEFSFFQGVAPGPSEVYNGVTIKSYIFPNVSVAFKDLPPQMEGFAPEKWTNYYAIKDDKLLLSFSADAQPIKNALDQMAGTGIGFDEGAGYDKLVDALTLENNMFLAISPITAVKSIVQLAAQADPNIGMIQMLLTNIPEAYSIGIAGQNRDSGVEGTVFVSLGDFKDVINMAVGMLQMQEMQQMQ